jgi:hypothetical protein
MLFYDDMHEVLFMSKGMTFICWIEDCIMDGVISQNESVTMVAFCG